MTDVPATEIEEWLADWLLSLHDKAESTVVVYERSVRQFLSYYGTRPLSEVTRRDVDGWLASLRADGKGESTRRVRLMALRAWFGWMITEPLTPITNNPADGIKAPAPDLPDIEVVPEENIAAVLKTCGGKSYVDLRDNAIIRLLYSCGLRRAELVGLDYPDDVDVREQYLVVTGKGDKTRVVSFGGSKTPLALSRYLRARRQHVGKADPALFLSTRSGPGRGYRLTGGAIALLLKRRCNLAGVPVFHPHQLRHTWAHATKVAGLSDEDLERMAGWSSPMMVRRYGRAMADERARTAHRDLGLGDRL